MIKKYKEEISIVTGVIIIVLLAGFILYNNTGFTGRAVLEQEGEEENITAITQEQALKEIEKAKLDMTEMIEKNFSVVYINDTIIEAERVYEQARYAEILRLGSQEEKYEAQKALKLIDWKDLSYNDVLQYTQEIEKRKEQSIEINDLILLSDIRIYDYSNQEVYVEEARVLIEEAKLAFKEERYDDTKKILDRVTDELESRKSDLATTNILTNAAKNFFQRYWWQLTLLLIILIILGIITHNRVAKRLLKRKIQKMKAEKLALRELMKKAQIERFKKNIIPGLVYKIRMQKYKERTEKIDETLPILEEKLQKKKQKKVEKKK